jgi:hypothetical protein
MTRILGSKMEGVLLAACGVLLVIWVTEIRAIAACPYPPNCPPPPTPDCTVNWEQYNGSIVTNCGGGVGECMWLICWYYDQAGICFNADKDDCFWWP